jgi:hypothetical protein
MLLGTEIYDAFNLPNEAPSKPVVKNEQRQVPQVSKVSQQIARIPTVPVILPPIQPVQPVYQLPATLTTTMKPKELAKTIVFILTIAIAIGVHSVCTFIIKEISISNIFSFKQELGVRILYPVLALVILYLLKPFTR